MTIDDFIGRFKACLNEVPLTELSAETRFKKLEEWSSILALLVIAMVDSEYGKVLTSEDIQKSDTIGELYLIIQSK